MGPRRSSNPRAAHGAVASLETSEGAGAEVEVEPGLLGTTLGIAAARETWSTATGTATTEAESANATAIETATGGIREISAPAAPLLAEHDRRCETFEIETEIGTASPESMLTEHGAALETAAPRPRARRRRIRSSA